MRRPDWSFDGTWPYDPQWFDTADGRMHYIDEGSRQGSPVVMIHGNPTWSYLYRHFVDPVVAAGHRCIVIDHLGFGRSDKPEDPDLYLLERSCRRLEDLLESLDLHNATPVVHDWGGPHGMYWASQHPDRIRSLCILNTYAHRLREPVELPLPARLMRTPGIGEFFVQRLGVFKKFTLFGGPTGVKRDRLTETLKAAYLAPHPNPGSRTGILRFFRNVPTEIDEPNSLLLGEIEDRLVTELKDRPVKICWGMKDPVFTEEDFLNRLWLAPSPRQR